jgi:hypothetical protein
MDASFLENKFREYQDPQRFRREFLGDLLVPGYFDLKGEEDAVFY